MSTFDPWTATIEEAIAAQELDTESPSYAQPIFQWQAVQWVNAERHGVEVGKPGAVLDAISYCAWHDLKMPDWLAKAFLKQYRAARHYQVRTWDEAFGPAHPGKINLRFAQRRPHSRVFLGDAMISVLRRGPCDRAIDREFWEEVGAVIGESGGQAEKLFLSAEQEARIWAAGCDLA